MTGSPDDDLRLALLRLTDPPGGSQERMWRRWLRETQIMADSSIDALSADGGQESPALPSPSDALWQRSEAGDR